FTMILFILSSKPYDGSDHISGALRLVTKLVEMGEDVKIFAISDAVDLVRAAAKKPESYDIDLQEIIKKILALNVPIKACGTSLKRSGEYKNEPYLNEDIRGSMDLLASWTKEASKVLTY
ncbi:MAG: DsrE family protein, partial [Arcobacteraceae bacterium]|nr:DsrE family protein [Arcobacteraceae bacterium]